MTFDEWLETKGSEAGYIEDLDPIEAAWNAAKADSAQEIERLRAARDEEIAIINRIWDIYGNPTYYELNGRSIYDLINKDRADLAAAKALLRGVLNGAGDYVRIRAALGDEP